MHIIGHVTMGDSSIDATGTAISQVDASRTVNGNATATLREKSGYVSGCVFETYSSDCVFDAVRKAHTYATLLQVCMCVCVYERQRETVCVYVCVMLSRKAHTYATVLQVCMCVSAYVYVHIHTHIHTCIHTYIHIGPLSSWLRCSAHKQHICTYIHACIHIYICTCAHIHKIHTYIIHTYIHTYIHTCKSS